MKNDQEKVLHCEWEFSHKRRNDKPHYVKCKNCGRIKRSDLPDIKPCTGSSVAYQAMLRKILGQDVNERDIKDLENKSLKPEEYDEGE